MTGTPDLDGDFDAGVCSHPADPEPSSEHVRHTTMKKTLANLALTPGATTMITITGDIAYRERIALVPGGNATITLLDTSRQDVAGEIIAETSIQLDDQQVPIPFELEADTAGLDTRGTYSVRATITGPDGAPSGPPTTSSTSPAPEPTRRQVSTSER